MKYVSLLFIAGLCLTACETDAQGKKHYTGPTLALNFGYNGATVGIGIVGQPSPIQAEAHVGFVK